MSALQYTYTPRQVVLNVENGSSVLLYTDETDNLTALDSFEKSGAVTPVSLGVFTNEELTSVPPDSHWTPVTVSPGVYVVQNTGAGAGVLDNLRDSATFDQNLSESYMRAVTMPYVHAGLGTLGNFASRNRSTHAGTITCMPTTAPSAVSTVYGSNYKLQDGTSTAITGPANIFQAGSSIPMIMPLCSSIDDGIDTIFVQATLANGDKGFYYLKYTSATEVVLDTVYSTVADVSDVPDYGYEVGVSSYTVSTGRIQYNDKIRFVQANGLFGANTIPEFKRPLGVTSITTKYSFACVNVRDEVILYRTGLITSGVLMEAYGVGAVPGTFSALGEGNDYWSLVFDIGNNEFESRVYAFDSDDSSFSIAARHTLVTPGGAPVRVQPADAVEGASYWAWVQSTTNPDMYRFGLYTAAGPDASGALHFLPLSEVDRSVNPVSLRLERGGGLYPGYVLSASSDPSKSFAWVSNRPQQTRTVRDTGGYEDLTTLTAGGPVETGTTGDVLSPFTGFTISDNAVLVARFQVAHGVLSAVADHWNVVPSESGQDLLCVSTDAAESSVSDLISAVKMAEWSRSADTEQVVTAWFSTTTTIASTLASDFQTCTSDGGVVFCVQIQTAGNEARVERFAMSTPSAPGTTFTVDGFTAGTTLTCPAAYDTTTVYALNDNQLVSIDLTGTPSVTNILAVTITATPQTVASSITHAIYFDDGTQSKYLLVVLAAGTASEPTFALPNTDTVYRFLAAISNPDHISALVEGASGTMYVLRYETDTMVIYPLPTTYSAPTFVPHSSFTVNDTLFTTQKQGNTLRLLSVNFTDHTAPWVVVYEREDPAFTVSSLSPGPYADSFYGVLNGTELTYFTVSEDGKLVSFQMETLSDGAATQVSNGGCAPGFGTVHHAGSPSVTVLGILSDHSAVLKSLDTFPPVPTATEAPSPTPTVQPPPVPTVPVPRSSSGKIPWWGIAMIVVLVVLLLGVGAFAVWWFRYRQKKLT